MSDPEGPSRRDFLKGGAAVIAGAGLAEQGCAAARWGNPFQGTVPQYDVIIIGTGFGATVAAKELLRPNKEGRRLNILMIERGVFFTSPERPLPPYLGTVDRSWYQYWPTPDTAAGLRRSFLPLVHLGKDSRIRKQQDRVPLYRYSRFTDVDIVSAIGVGGGSLIYSNVSLEPYRDGSGAYPILKDWPITLDQPAFDAARAWMRDRRSPPGPGAGVPASIVTSVPVGKALQGDLKDLGSKALEYLYLPRSNAFRKASQRVKGAWTVNKPWEPLDLQLFEHDVTPTSIVMPDKTRRPVLAGQRICERQGRCFLGCLPGARHTLNKALFPELSGQSPALKVRPLSDVWQIHETQQGGKAGYEVIGRDVATSDEFRVWAPVVIMAAGVVGTSEILLRSRDVPRMGTRPMRFSKLLGHGFSTNGDFSGFVKGIPKVVKNQQGQMVDNRVFPTKGPINTSHFSLNYDGMQINVEDAGIPPMFAGLARAMVNASGSGGKISFGRMIRDLIDTGSGRISEHEMAEDLFWFNCMGDDRTANKPFIETGGRFSVDKNGRLDLSFPAGSPTRHPLFTAIERVLDAFAKDMTMDDKATYVPFPAWSGTFGQKKLVVTHPLGGCPMGKSSSEGVVDAEGRVFDMDSGTTVHPGLYVMDGSVLPGPVAVNPTLTIVAVALKAINSVRTHLGLTDA
jgi:choline dehydrogenase-like flavoprotein